MKLEESFFSGIAPLDSASPMAAVEPESPHSTEIDLLSKRLNQFSLKRQKSFVTWSAEKGEAMHRPSPSPNG
jgi:hypothetical protein